MVEIFSFGSSISSIDIDVIECDGLLAYGFENAWCELLYLHTY